MTRRTRRSVGSFLVLLLLATAYTTIGIPSRAQAAGDLEWDTKLTYRLKVDEGAVNLVSDITVTNKKGNRRDGNTITQFYFDRIWIYVPQEAGQLSITSDGKELDYTVEEEVEEEDEIVGVDLLEIRFPRRIFYNRSVDIRVEYDIPGDDPRSDSLFRVNPAYASFSVIAWGDPGRIEVVVMLDDQFVVDAWGAEYDMSHEGSDTVFTMTEIDDPTEWYMLFTARSDDHLTDSRASLTAFDVNVRSWPSDQWWASEVEATVQTGLPVLYDLVGLDWRPEEELEIRESIEPNLLGYGGWYLETGDVIEIGEFVDRHLVLHEIGHSWFNEDLFVERWITEGLSDEFAASAVNSLVWSDMTGYEVADEPPRRDGIFSPPLNEWVVPEGDEVRLGTIEEYGYTMSWWVMHEITEEIGMEAIRAVISAADLDEIAYRGDGDPETVDPEDDWRRFLDLVQEVGGSEAAPDLLDEWVLSEADSLDARKGARATYARLKTEAGDWSMPMAVREPMSSWNFATAEALMASAAQVLATRNEIQDLADELGVEPPTSLETAYEMADTSFEPALALAADQKATAESVLRAKEAVEDDLGLLETIGLIGVDIDLELMEAVQAFEQDELEASNSEAEEALALMTASSNVGTSRATKAAAGVLAFLLLITVLAFWLRRSSSASSDDNAPISDGTDLTPVAPDTEQPPPA